MTPVSEMHNQLNHHNVLTMMRAAINQRLNDAGREFDIVRDVEFKQANDLLDAKFNYLNLIRTRGVKPILHITKNVVDCEEDILRILTYLAADNDAQVLQYKAWFHLELHFMPRGIAFYSQLSLNSFIFSRDEEGREYVALADAEDSTKFWTDDLDNVASHRLYATGNVACPVYALRKYLIHCYPTAQALFCTVRNEPLGNCWYSCKPIARYDLLQFMTNISEKAKCSTTHCLSRTQTTNKYAWFRSLVTGVLKKLPISSGHAVEMSSGVKGTVDRRSHAPTVNRPRGTLCGPRETPCRPRRGSGVQQTYTVGSRHPLLESLLRRTAPATQTAQDSSFLSRKVIGVTTSPQQTSHAITTLPQQTSHDIATLPQQTSHTIATFPHQTLHDITSQSTTSPGHVTTCLRRPRSQSLIHTDIQVPISQTKVDVSPSDSANVRVIIGSPPADNVTPADIGSSQPKIMILLKHKMQSNS